MNLQSWLFASPFAIVYVFVRVYMLLPVSEKVRNTDVEGKKILDALFADLDPFQTLPFHLGFLPYISLYVYVPAADLITLFSAQCLPRQILEPPHNIHTRRVFRQLGLVEAKYSVVFA